MTPHAGPSGPDDGARSRVPARTSHPQRPYTHLADPPGPEIEMSPELDRVPASPVVLDPAQEERVERLARTSVVISLHDHASVRPMHPTTFGEYRRRGREWTPYAGLRASPLDVVFDGGLAGIGRRWRTRRWHWGDTVHDLRVRQADWVRGDAVRAVRTLGDVEACARSATVGIVLALESATPIRGDLDRLDELYALGVRSMGVTYSTGNRLGNGCDDPNDGGLTRFGTRAVARMNELGILVDVSHAGDRTSLEVIDASRAPVVISHAGARSMWGSPRMKTDDVIRACAASGGLIGIEAAPGSTLAHGRTNHTFDDVFRHFLHCLDLVGVGHVTFGPDTHYGDHVAWNLAFGNGSAAEGVRRLSPPWVVGCENPTEAWWNILRRLVRDGFADDDIRAVVGGNALRVMQSAWSRD